MKVKRLLIVFIFISFALAIFGFSYSYFSTKIDNNELASSVILETATLSLDFIDGDYIYEESMLAPWTDTKTFTIENTGNASVKYNIMWDNLTNTLVGKEALTYSITSTGEGAKTMGETQIPNSGQNIIILDNINIEPGDTHSYTITFNYANTSFDQSSDMEKTFRGKIKIEDYIS